MTKVRRSLAFGFVGLLIAAALAYFGAEQLPLLQRTSVTPSLVPQTWASVRESPGHQAHVGKDQIACRDCHDESDGGFRSLKEAACTSTCHAAEVARTHAGDTVKPTTCLTCHAFGAQAAPTCLECHASAQGKSAAVAVHIGAKSPCTTCHNPHQAAPTAQADCATCHQDVVASHGTMHVSGEAKQQHAVVVATDASRDALAPPNQWFGATARATHVANGTCSDCHAPHAHAVEARGTCQGCHEGAPRGNKPSGHPACVTCHAPHELTRGATKACASCHAAKRASLTPSHAACQTCHAPHATQAAAGACTTCHSKTVTLGAPRVEAHAACGNCHKPHDAKASPGGACMTCHGAMAVKHAPGRAEKCTDCHAMHPARAVGSPLAVSNGGAGHAPLAVACTSCHKQAPTDVSAHPKGAPCTSCHKPHDFALSMAKGAFCAKCHASETKVALASRGHTDCVKCHSDIHKPTRGPPCATCHSAEAASAPQGHRACDGCHEPHDGHVKPSATCQSCHAPEASTKHAHVKGACATCHRPHGPSGPTGPAGAMAAPSCTSCHEPAKLPGLHQLVGGKPAGHGQCATCHGAHQPPRADRATCTTCHEKQKNHQPAATQCNGCHIFRRP